MYRHGWRSVCCKGSAPINLSDRLHQVLCWALGYVEIFLSRHCPIWYGYGGGLKWLERFSYINSVVYPWTSLRLIVYCSLPAVCLLTGKFIYVYSVSRFVQSSSWSYTNFTVTPKAVDNGAFSELYIFKDRMPTIIVVWSILLASILTLLWVRANPFVAKGGPVLEICGLNCGN